MALGADKEGLLVESRRDEARSNRMGRTRSTSAAELSRIGLQLFIERDFDSVTIDDIAAAAGIGRRTFFRYFTSKNDVPWGDFDALLSAMREYLANVPSDVPLIEALRDAVIEFNRFPDEVVPDHRRRMELLLTTPTLVAHSTLRYEEWRQVIAEFVAGRLGVPTDALQPQTVGWACLGISLAAYERWLAHESAVLTDLIDEGFREMREVFSAAAVPDAV